MIKVSTSEFLKLSEVEESIGIKDRQLIVINLNGTGVTLNKITYVAGGTAVKYEGGDLFRVFKRQGEK